MSQGAFFHDILLAGRCYSSWRGVSIRLHFSRKIS
jgi:hypothetical protein